MTSKRDVLSDQRVCADCGGADDLYFHEVEGEWVCEEVSDCLERQWDADRADRDRLLVENEQLDEERLINLHAAEAHEADAQRLRAEVKRIGKEADQYRKGWLEKTIENERLREAVLAAYNALSQVHVDHSRAHNVKYTARAMDVLRAELRGSTDEEIR